MNTAIVSQRDESVLNIKSGYRRRAVVATKVPTQAQQSSHSNLLKCIAEGDTLAMRLIFFARLKQIGAAVFLSCFIAVGIATFIESSVAGNSEAITILVNRNNKGDRLPQSSTLTQPASNLSPTERALPIAIPLGCDPAFSPVADPMHAYIFGRCMT
jgi:hypothetical protein